MKAYKLKIEQDTFPSDPTTIIPLQQPHKGLIPDVISEFELIDQKNKGESPEEQYELIEATDPESQRPLTFMLKTSDLRFYNQLVQGLERAIIYRAQQRKNELESQITPIKKTLQLAANEMVMFKSSLLDRIKSYVNKKIGRSI